VKSSTKETFKKFYDGDTLAQWHIQYEYHINSIGVKDIKNKYVYGKYSDVIEYVFLDNVIEKTCSISIIKIDFVFV
jgi:hypothetical protein